MKLAGKNFLIGVTGGIAAYKTCYLIRLIKKLGGEVKTILTRSGEQFVTRTTFEALSGEQVAVDLFEPVQGDTIQHIDLARWADCFIIAPATANIIGKTTSGIADDLLSTVISAYPSNIIFAPAMNDEMWKNKVTQENIKKLTDLNHVIVQPGTGDLACDTVGEGRMAEPDIILEKTLDFLNIRDDLEDKKILVTAGGTREKIDPVRYIGNRSSGKMGIALAEAAKARGADVTLISSNCTVEIPPGFKVLSVDTAAEMAKAVKKEFKKNDILIMAAAVADFTPDEFAAEKIKKDNIKDPVIKLKITEDILSAVSKKKGSKITIGFALETENEIENALQKLSKKNLDLIVINNPKERGAGFDHDTNIVTLISKEGKVPQKFPVLTKREIGDIILDELVKIIDG